MNDCLFCKIAAGQIPSKTVYEDEQVYAFYDIDPQAPTHFLVIPKKHVSCLDECTEEDEALLGHMLLTAMKLAAEQGLENGYRIVINTGDDGGQTVKHLHMHVMGKRSMNWPPG
ncbi:MAG: histidine triad nucleotide-binding protein [Oscillospiraceae bacterium]|nr:histidine triad nucleotide-binding protein [Oscillospiraceae bacterium]